MPGRAWTAMMKPWQSGRAKYDCFQPSQAVDSGNILARRSMRQSEAIACQNKRDDCRSEENPAHLGDGGVCAEQKDKRPGDHNPSDGSTHAHETEIFRRI